MFCKFGSNRIIWHAAQNGGTKDTDAI